jgi:hypothetical protein
MLTFSILRVDHPIPLVLLSRRPDGDSMPVSLGLEPTSVVPRTVLLRLHAMTLLVVVLEVTHVHGTVGKPLSKRGEKERQAKTK